MTRKDDDQTRTQKSPTPRRFPDPHFGREAGRESPIPDSAGIGKQGIPVSR